MRALLRTTSLAGVLALTFPVTGCGRGTNRQERARVGPVNGRREQRQQALAVAAAARSGSGGMAGDGQAGTGGTSSGGSLGTAGTVAGAGGTAAGTSGGAPGHGGDSGSGASGSSGQRKAGSRTGGTGGASAHVGFYVDGRYLRDKCGEKVVLRGINEMVIYTSTQDGTPYFAEMAKTGANSVRITWNTTGAVSKLDAAMKNAIAAQMIPMPVLNDATGDLTKLNAEVNYWVRSDVVAVIQKYQDKALINIGNEVGNGSVTQSQFLSAYTSAITSMRSAGIHTPLVIDGSTWGQDIDMLQATAPMLTSADPDHNIIYSVHMYWTDPNGTRVMSEISQSVTQNLPLIVGEFAQHAVAGCSSSPFAYKTLLALAQQNDIGYLPWSWGGAINSDCKSDQPFDMSSNGTFSGLQGWGREVAVSDANSIMNTSKRSHYMTAGACN